MALIKLTSTNPDLSWIISKNPESGLIAKSIRQGTAWGFFKDNTYVVWFKDADTEVSYKSYPDEQFEFMNLTRYTSAMFILNSISEFFRSTVKDQHDKDLYGFVNTVEINAVEAYDERYFELFSTHFPDFQISYTSVAGSKKFFSLKIETKCSIHDLLNYLTVLMILTVMKNDNDMLMLDEANITKYMTSLNKIDAPYFIRYVFKVNLLRTPNLFKAFKKQLEQTNKHSLDLVKGTTLDNRLDFVKQAAFSQPTKNIVDYGCGEGNYVRLFASYLYKNPEIAYFALDIDAEALEKTANLAKRKQLENVQVFNLNEDSFLFPEDGSTVILSEVLEHMPLDQAMALLGDITKPENNVKSIIITVPNKQFNKHYMVETRHKDHVHEFEGSDIACLMAILLGEGFDVKTGVLGDTVDGLSPTFTLLATKGA